MANKIKVVDKQADRIKVTGRTHRRIDPAKVAAALGAEPIVAQEWTISRSKAKFIGWHYQARTKDQLSSFAIVAPDNSHNISMSKTPDGRDVFTLVSDGGTGTMNVVGKIEYEGDWDTGGM